MTQVKLAQNAVKPSMISAMSCDGLLKSMSLRRNHLIFVSEYIFSYMTHFFICHLFVTNVVNVITKIQQFCTGASIKAIPLSVKRIYRLQVYP